MLSATLRVGRGLAVPALALLAVGTAGLARAQDEAKPKAKAKTAVQRASGVIVKAEPIAGRDGDEKTAGKREGRPGRVRLTINTAVVWRDFVRDQADLSAKPDAKKGEESVAAKGQPKTAESLVTVEVTRASDVEGRFRSSTDEASDGARTIAGAVREEKDPADRSGVGKEVRKESRAVGTLPKMTATDLKPGLWVEVDYRKNEDRTVATKVFVLKPVGGPDTPVRDEVKSETK